MTIAGNDDGEFSALVLAELRAAFRGEHRPQRFFIDSRNVLGISPSVNNAWIQFLRENPYRPVRTDVLALSRVMRLMVETVQHFSRSDIPIHFHSNEQVFDALIKETSEGDASMRRTA